jgi:hypothetical protein
MQFHLCAIGRRLSLCRLLVIVNELRARCQGVGAKEGSALARQQGFQRVGKLARYVRPEKLVTTISRKKFDVWLTTRGYIHNCSVADIIDSLNKEPGRWKPASPDTTDGTEEAVKNGGVSLHLFEAKGFVYVKIKTADSIGFTRPFIRSLISI